MTTTTDTGTGWIITGTELGELIYGSALGDTIQGLDGDDTIHGYEEDRFPLDGNEGADSIDGGAGNDDIRAALYGAPGIGWPGSTAPDTVDGGAGNDTITGSLGDNLLMGGSGDDSIGGWYGQDTLQGGEGHDTLNGHEDEDLLQGGDGNDVLDGGSGIDTLEGGAGNDLLTIVALEDDILVGGAGDDTLTGYVYNDQAYGIATYSGARSDYQVTYVIGANGLPVFTVTDLRTDSPDGTDTVSRITTFAFSDGTVDYRPGTIADFGRISELDITTNTEAPLGVADLMLTGPEVSFDQVVLLGEDAALFELRDGTLYLRAGVSLADQTDPVLDVALRLQVPGALPEGGYVDRDYSVYISGWGDLGETPPILGTAGDDTLRGTAADEFLDAAGTAGSWQFLSGFGGNDIYSYSRESGLVYIGEEAETATSGTADTVVFNDLLLSDFRGGVVDYAQYAFGGDQVALRLIWQRDGARGELRIADMGSEIETYRFADGLELTQEQLVELLLTNISGGAGDDYLRGNAVDNILDAGGTAGAWQYLEGYEGNDTYRYGTHSGLVYITQAAETATSGTFDRVVFSDLDIDDFTFATFDYTGSTPAGDQTALRMMWQSGTAQGELRIADMASEIEAFVFADGTAMTRDAFISRISDRTGGAGDDVLDGNALDNTLDVGGSAGSWQQMRGYDGNDTYLYSRAAGLVYIADFAETADSGDADVLVFSDLMPEDLIVRTLDYSAYSFGGDQVALRLIWSEGGARGEVRIADMGSEIETYRFADGTELTAEDLWDMIA